MDMDPSAWAHRPPSPPLSSQPIDFERAFTDLTVSSSGSDQAGPSQSPTSATHSTPSRQVQIPIGGAVLSPPTPAPSPNPRDRTWPGFAFDADQEEDEAETTSDPGDWKGKGREVQTTPTDLIDKFKALSTSQRYAFLSALVDNLALPEALVLSRNIQPKLRRDFLKELPIELALYTLSFIDDAQSLARASQVSRYWSQLLGDETTWKEMCQRHQYGGTGSFSATTLQRKIKALPSGYPNRSTNLFRGVDPRPLNLSDMWNPQWSEPSYRQQYKTAYQTESNWLHGGRLLANYTTGDDSVVTTVSFDDNFLVVGTGNGKIHMYDSKSGEFRRSLKGHEMGVWALVLVSPVAKSRDGDMPRFKRLQTSTSTRASQGSGKRSSSFGGAGSSTQSQSFFSSAYREASVDDPCNATRGWSGLNRPIVVSGGCDRLVKVWDANSGACIYTMSGHTSTVRCLKVVDGKPLAVTGSRDESVRVWDIEKGRLVHTMTGHVASVRCIDVSGTLAVSGSYDYTCRVWNIETGRCIHILRGHYHQIYAVAFQGDRVVSGSLDSTVRIWSASSGQCTALLQGHTSLVGQLQLSGDRLVTGGSDGRVIVFDLTSQSCLLRLCAHDNSVTCLQFDHRFIISGGNDGRVKLWNMQTGKFIRELTKPCDVVWRVAFRDDKCAIQLSRKGKTVLEVITFRPEEIKGTRYTPRVTRSGERKDHV